MQPGPAGKESPKPFPRRRWQFGIGSLLLLTTLLSLLTGAFAGMIRVPAGEPLLHSRLYLVLAIAAPLGMLMVIGGCRTLIHWWGKRKNRDL
ncbi:MAG: hypothetical protein JXB10_06735 [Pirellulales bacterium]|nr:hypothetical protein [Pirellulales bacterium]